MRLAVLASLVFTPIHSNSEEYSFNSPATLFNRYCIGPDGDHRATWQYVEDDGFVPLTPDDIPDPIRRGTFVLTLRGFKKTIGPNEVRVITGANRTRIPDQGATYFRWCWLSSTASDAAEANRQMREILGQRGFRSERVRVYAWIPRPDEVLEPISRRRYFEESNIIARTQGLRQVFVRENDGVVFMAYASPRTEETYQYFDWSGPEPVPAPQR